MVATALLDRVPARAWPMSKVGWWLALLPLPLIVVPVSGAPAPVLVLALVTMVLAASLPGLVPALIARGGLWFVLLTGALVGLTGPGRDAHEALYLLYPAGWALLWLGRPEGGAAFAPIAFRTPLLAAMVLGCADAFWLLTAAVMRIAYPGRFEHGLTAVMALGSALVLVAVWGTARLQLWGLLLGLTCNTTIIASVAWRLSEMPRGAWVAGVLLAGGAVAHTLIQIPLLVAVLRGIPPRWAQHDFRWVGPAVVVLPTLLVSARLLLWRLG